LVSLRDAVAPRASAIPPTTRQGIGRHCDAPSGTLLGGPGVAQTAHRPVTNEADPAPVERTPG
jgi:hypothetical protein